MGNYGGNGELKLSFVIFFGRWACMYANERAVQGQYDGHAKRDF